MPVSTNARPGEFVWGTAAARSVTRKVNLKRIPPILVRDDDDDIRMAPQELFVVGLDALCFALTRESLEKAVRRGRVASSSTSACRDRAALICSNIWRHAAIEAADILTGMATSNHGPGNEGRRR